LKPLLLPLLLSQAWHARLRAPVLPEAEGERSGIVAPGDRAALDTLKVLIVGDSSAAGVGVMHQEQALVGHLTRALAARTGLVIHWQLVARKGVTTAQALQLVQSEPLRLADLAVVALGVNDIIDRVSTSRALRQRGRLAAWLRQHAGVRHVVFAPLPPVHRLPLLRNPLRWVAGADARAHDAAVARWAARRSDVHHVPIEPDVSPHNMAADGFHPAEPVYRHVGEELARFIAERLVGPAR
jgi:lysophospholipase L1-like esterase